MTDLIGEVPNVDSIALKQHLRFMRIFIEAINGSVREIKYQQARLSLQALVDAAHNRSQDCGEGWAALYEQPCSATR